MLDEKIEQLVAMLEKQELESSSVSVQLYCELLAAYLYQNDLINANYLWKRIPANLKTGNKELEQLRLVYRHLANNDYPAFYRAVEYDWSRTLTDLMIELKNKKRNEMIATIGRTYCTIFQSVLANLTNSPHPDDVAEICKSQNWEIEPAAAGSEPVIKVKKPVEERGVAMSEDQLATLTDFISFLEN